MQDSKHECKHRRMPCLNLFSWGFFGRRRLVAALAVFLRNDAQKGVVGASRVAGRSVNRLLVASRTDIAHTFARTASTRITWRSLRPSRTTLTTAC
jgi:hypothetical protein